MVYSTAVARFRSVVIQVVSLAHGRGLRRCQLAERVLEARIHLPGEVPLGDDDGLELGLRHQRLNVGFERILVGVEFGPEGRTELSRGSFLKPVDNLPPGRAIVVAARKVRLTQDARGGRGESHEAEAEAAKDCPKIVRVSHSCLILYAQKYVVEVS